MRMLQDCEKPPIRSMEHTSQASRQAAAMHQLPQAVQEYSHGTLTRNAGAQGRPRQDPQQCGQLVPPQNAEGKHQEGNTPSHNPQQAGRIPEMASSQHESLRAPSEQQVIQRARSMVSDSSAPTLSGNPLCPSLHLNLFTQVAPLQPPYAAQSQTQACAESMLPSGKPDQTSLQRRRVCLSCAHMGRD